MSRYFQILTSNETIYDGTHQLNAAVTTAQVGMLAKMSGSELVLATASDKPVGFLFKSTSSDLHKPSYDYAANNDVIRATYVTICFGHGIAQCDAAGFIGAALPSVGDAVYTAASGLMDTSGSNQVGTVVALDTVRAARSASVQVARIQFEIAGF